MIYSLFRPKTVQFKVENGLFSLLSYSSVDATICRKSNFVQYNLDLETLLASAKTVTKSLNVTILNDFMY